MPQRQQRQHHTYAAGQDENSRMARAAQSFGLAAREQREAGQGQQNQRRKSKWKGAFDDLLTSARMHSIGAIGDNEVLDSHGTIHRYRHHHHTHHHHPTTTIQQHQQQQRRPQEYGTLHDLFQQPLPDQKRQRREDDEDTSKNNQEDASSTVSEESYDEEEEIPGGGTLFAAVFGIIKGTVGPAILYLPKGFLTAGYAVAIVSMVVATCLYIVNAHRLLDCWRCEKSKTYRELQQEEQEQDDGRGGVRVSKELVLLHTTPSRKPILDRLAAQQDGSMHEDEEENFNFNSNNFSGSDNRNGNGQEKDPLQSKPLHLNSSQDTPEATIESTSTASTTMLTYPELARRAFDSTTVISMVEFGIASMQGGVCLTYLIFVSQNLFQVFNEVVSKNTLLWLMVLVECPLCWIQDIRKLTLTNVIASLLIFVGLLLVIALALYEAYQPSTITPEDGTKVWQDNLADIPAMNTETWFLFVGTSFFMMEGSITLLIPLQEAVARPQDIKKFPSYNQWATTWIVVVYIFFSIICVAAFGTSLTTALTASLRAGVITRLIQLFYSIAVCLTFPLQFFPAMQVVVSKCFGKETNVNSTARSAVVTGLVLTLGLVGSTSMNYLGNVVSLIGSLFGIPLACLYPPMMHNRLVGTNVTHNYGIMVIGLFAMAAASTATISSWKEGAEE